MINNKKRYIRNIRKKHRIIGRCLLILMLTCIAIYQMSSYQNMDDMTHNTQHIGRTLLEEEDNSLYPDDLLTSKQRANGGILLHIVGVLYMFLALAIVCDDYFVPALEVITDKLDVDEDVAGATFMAAGGSAPELFTSFIGTFIAKSNVGFGTIVGSAIFNILFVIGACVMASPDELILRWWPLARDCTFYSLYLVVLLLCFNDQKIHWYEAFILLICYGIYVFFMSKNTQAEKWFRENVVMRWCARRRKITIGGVEKEVEIEDDPALQSLKHLKRRASEAGLIRHGRISFHAGALRVIMSELDPKGKGPEKEKEKRMKTAAKFIIARNVDERNRRNSGGTANVTIGDVVTGFERTGTSSKVGTPEPMVELATNNSGSHSADESSSRRATQEDNISGGGGGGVNKYNDNNDGPTAGRTITDGSVEETTINAEGGDDDNPGLNYGWPEGLLNRIWYVMLAPIYLPLFYTLPDCSLKRNHKYFPITFLGSIGWIGFYAYLMVWWATVIGDTLNIPPEVMGLTFLAAGTSVPDLLTSVIVARKGFGDMAVSSSIGSNIFDITVGLPLPWIAYTIINNEVLSVGTAGLVISVIVLFAMLLTVIITIAINGWKLTKPLGYTMFVLYAIFLTQSLLVEYDVV